MKVTTSLPYSFRIIRCDDDTTVFFECSYKSLPCLLRSLAPNIRCFNLAAALCQTRYTVLTFRWNVRSTRSIFDTSLPFPCSSITCLWWRRQILCCGLSYTTFRTIPPLLLMRIRSGKLVITLAGPPALYPRWRDVMVWNVTFKPEFNCKGKNVACTLVQALRFYTGRTAHRWSRGIALLFLDHGTGRGEGLASRPGRSLPPGKTRYPLYGRLGRNQGRSGQAQKISPTTGIRSRIFQPVPSYYTDYATRPTGIKSRPHIFDVKNLHVLHTQCICVFCVDLRTNSDYFPIQH